MYAQGDRNYPPSGVMPDGCYFINAIERQMPIDDDTLNPEDNLEEFSALTDADIAYYKQSVDKAAATGRTVVASFGGAALGDVGLLPAMGLKNPKGIRSISEWYMSTLIRQDYIHEVLRRKSIWLSKITPNCGTLWVAKWMSFSHVVQISARRKDSSAHWMPLWSSGSPITASLTTGYTRIRLGRR